MSRSIFASNPAGKTSPGIEVLPTERESSQLLGINPNALDTLPFAAHDTTAGCENELQVAVFGRRDTVDLPRYIEGSSYFENIIKRAMRGDTSSRAKRNLDRYLSENIEQVWENSWVRFPLRNLEEEARQIFYDDLLADKSNPQSGQRTDVDRFFFLEGGERALRVPISYLLKLSLTDAISAHGCGEGVRRVGRRLASHLVSDNTSPETFSFHVVGLNRQNGYGRALARETAKRYLFTQLLLTYANEKFGLSSRGQKATLFFSPHPPLRQRHLNECISDSFYRELFMSPCLSGWDEGEAKHSYMVLCHQVLSRSHLNAVMKLREAGIITSNLVVFPQTSNISLANNGTHVSLGSKKLSLALRDPSSGFTPRHEKYLGDLVAKIFEHFLPLFVGTYSAAPYRLAFEDFHPEKVLGFLPHELDFTHLRMIWRRWRGKARNKFCGHSFTPFGPQLLDHSLAGLLRFRGDFVPDFRLLDYPVALLSTERSCSQNGIRGNDLMLREDLDALGVFDKRMSIYLPYKLRESSVMGFSGFEGRYYSQFSDFGDDMAKAVDLQMLLNALAFKLIAKDICRHQDIPDTSFIESERRQILFGTAIGLPTFFVHKKTSNRFLRRILEQTKGTRSSRRYPGYLRVLNREYRLALVDIIEEEACDLIEALSLQDVITDLRQRITELDRHSAAGKLVRGILEKAGATSPFDLAAKNFNEAAEHYYREDLRERQMFEAWEYVSEDIRSMVTGEIPQAVEMRQEMAEILNGQKVQDFLSQCRSDFFAEELQPDMTARLLQMMILAVDLDAKRQKHGI